MKFTGSFYSIVVTTIIGVTLGAASAMQSVDMHLEADLTHELHRAIKSEHTSRVFYLISELRKNFPSKTALCSHLIDALGFAASEDKPKSFEILRTIAMAAPSAEHAAMYAGIALERAVMVGWMIIVDRILHEEAMKPKEAQITDEFFQAALLTALVRRDCVLVRIFINNYGFEKVHDLVMSMPAKTTVYLPVSCEEAETPVCLSDLVAFLNKCKPAENEEVKAQDLIEFAHWATDKYPAQKFFLTLTSSKEYLL